MIAKTVMTPARKKWSVIYEDLQRGLRGGAYPQDVPLPSEEALVRKYNVSRITVVKAMEELRARGLVYRRRGSGTYATRLARQEAGRLGLILPSLSVGEIFPVICQSLMRCAQQDGYSLVLGDISSSRPNERAHEACDVARLFVRQDVSGVIFQPLAFLRTPERVTREILAMLREAGIPVVLIDRNLSPQVSSEAIDFVGMDNLDAGRQLGAHLLSRGARRILFLMRPNCAPVIRDRMDGVRSALGDRGSLETIVAEPTDQKALKGVFPKRRHPDAVVCESDYVAAQLNNTLAKLGVSVPRDVLLAGFDDVRCAVSVTPNLTTVRQPCEDIGRMAYLTLRERMRNPSLPARRILLPGTLVIRESG